MDVIGIHPYPGYDRSFEEEGTTAAITQLRTMMTSAGVGSKPIFDSEQGWWSDGEEAYYDVGNWAPREWMWLRSMGISDWNYFIPEGFYSGQGTDFSVIEATNADEYVKPGVIGLMTATSTGGSTVPQDGQHRRAPRVRDALRSRRRRPGDSDVLAVWTDDLTIAADITTTDTGTDTIAATESLGAPSSFSVAASPPAALTLSGAPIYLTVPTTESISVIANESFGTNLRARELRGDGDSLVRARAGPFSPTWWRECTK